MKPRQGLLSTTCRPLATTKMRRNGSTVPYARRGKTSRKAAAHLGQELAAQIGIQERPGTAGARCPGTTRPPDRRRAARADRSSPRRRRCSPGCRGCRCRRRVGVPPSGFSASAPARCTDAEEARPPRRSGDRVQRRGRARIGVGRHLEGERAARRKVGDPHRKPVHVLGHPVQRGVADDHVDRSGGLPGGQVADREGQPLAGVLSRRRRSSRASCRCRARARPASGRAAYG